MAFCNNTATFWIEGGLKIPPPRFGVNATLLWQSDVDATCFVFQRESTRLLSWLQSLKETHGSVEQSSLSLATSINAHGAYHIGWSDQNTEKVSEQSPITR